MAKYFLHTYFAAGGELTRDHAFLGAIEVTSWHLEPAGLMVTSATHGRVYNGFHPGDRHYLVANDGSSLEPCGTVIWSWEGGSPKALPNV